MSISTTATDTLSALPEGDRAALERALAESQYILALPDDFDDMGAKRYEKRTWELAAQFLRRYAEAFHRRTGRAMPLPTIGPGPDGSIDLFWKEPDFELLVSIPEDPETPAGFYGDDRGRHTIKGNLDATNFNSGLIEWLMK